MSVLLHNTTLKQGWEFALWFLESIAHFLSAKERFTSEKEQITLM